MPFSPFFLALLLSFIPSGDNSTQLYPPNPSFILHTTFYSHSPSSPGENSTFTPFLCWTQPYLLAMELYSSFILLVAPTLSFYFLGSVHSQLYLSVAVSFSFIFISADNPALSSWCALLTLISSGGEKTTDHWLIITPCRRSIDRDS